MILKPLQRIRIIDSVKMCKGGSLGYFIAQEAVGGYNSWNMSILFTRFGKAGKPRLYPLPVNTLMLDYSALSRSDKIIIDTIKFYDGIEPRPYIGKDGLQQTSIGTTSLEPIPMEHKNLLDLSDNEFTAYTIALSLFINKLTKRTLVTNLHHARALRFGEFANGGFNLALTNSEHVGYYILLGLRLRDDERKVGIGGGNGKLFAESYSERIGNRAGRRELLSKLHMSLAMSKKAFIEYNKSTFSCFSSIDARMSDILKYYRRNKNELASIKTAENLRTKIYSKKDARVPIRGRTKVRRA